MSIDQLEEHQKDFQKYLEFLQSRKYLTDTESQTKIEIIYKKIYMLSTLSLSISEIDSRSFIEDFYFECKNNLILSLDLCNINYYNASKQILRSAIESFFRLSLALEKHLEYRKNKEQRIFQATPTLKQLKEMQFTHSVGRLTKYVINYYSETCINDVFARLYESYSVLSGNVHVNKKENFTPHRYLMDYVSIDKVASEDCLYYIEGILNYVIIILYYFTLQLMNEGVFFTKRDITEFAHTLDTSLVLDEIEKTFNI